MKNKKTEAAPSANDNRETARKRINEVITAITNANGTLYREAIERSPEVGERFHRAAMREGTAEEIEAAWRDYSRLVDRAFRQGRLFDPRYVKHLAPLLHLVAAEQEELERIKHAFDVVGDDPELAERIVSPCSHIPIFSVVDALADAVRAPRDEARLAAGYLSEECQPGKLRTGT